MILPNTKEHRGTTIGFDPTLRNTEEQPEVSSLKITLCLTLLKSVSQYTIGLNNSNWLSTTELVPKTSGIYENQE